MKPFAELSMVKRLLEHSNVQQFRYFKVLIQEFHIKVDIVFINAIMGLLEANEINDAEEVSSGTIFARFSCCDQKIVINEIKIMYLKLEYVYLKN